MSLHYLGKHKPRKWVSSVIHCLKNVTVLACYIFDYHSLILIIFWQVSCEVYFILSLFNFSCSFAITPLSCCKFKKAKIIYFLTLPVVCQHGSY